jgi:hypothetical protein
MAELFANTKEPIALLAALITSGAKTLTVTSTSKMPANLLLSGEFRIILGEEIMMISSIGTGTNWTILARGLEGTTAKSHTVAEGASIFHKFTAGAASTIALATTTAITAAQATVIAVEASEHVRTLPNLRVAAYEFKLSDQGKTVEYESFTADGVFTIAKSIFEVGVQLFMCQTGSHKVSIVGGTGVEVKTPGGLKPQTDAQWSTITARRRAGVGPEQWVLAGDLEI